MKRIHLFISGRVQRVGLRIRTKLRASLLNLKGWVRNLPDGRVEAIFEGDEKNIEKIIDYYKKTPLFTKITNLKLKKEKYKGEFNKFKIKRLKIK